MELWSWPSLSMNRSKFRQEAEVLLYVVSLISSSTGYIWQRYFSKYGIFIWNLHNGRTGTWNWTEMLTVSFPLRAETWQIPLRMSIERCQLDEGLCVPIGMSSFCWKSYSQNPGKILSIQDNYILIKSSSEYLLLESGCLFTKQDS